MSISDPLYEGNTPTLECNIAEAEAFLYLLDPDAKAFTFQTLDDARLPNGKPRDRADLRQTYHEAFAKIVAHLVRLNIRFKAAVYAVINETDLKGRTADSILSFRAFWVDLDRGLPIAWQLPPSIIVQTSPGKYQAYWLFDGDISDADFLGVLRHICLRYGGDPGVNSIERILRLPGFWHLKAEPFRVCIVEASGRRYTIAEILAVHPPVDPGIRAGAEPAGPTADDPVPLDLLRDALRVIDPDAPDAEGNTRTGWRDVGMGLHHDHGEEGRALWWSWSAGAPEDGWRYQSSKFDEAQQEKAWRSFSRRRKGGKLVTGATVLWMAGKIGWKRPRSSANEDIMSNDTQAADSRGISHDALALRFAERHGQNLRYVKVWDRWMLWTGTHWQEEQTLKAFDLARALAREEAARSFWEEKPAIRKELRSAATVSAIERLARTDRSHAATADIWDRDPWLLSTPGGTVDLKTGKLRPARREDCITKMTAVAPAPEGTGCPPLWTHFLETTFRGDRELINYMQRVAGYGLTGITLEHIMFFCWGREGRNGKGTLFHTLRKIMGSYGQVLVQGQLEEKRHDGHKTELADLRGARLVIGSETKGNARWNETLVKSLTGGDPVKANFMRQDHFTYEPEFKLVVLGNNKPALRSVNKAMTERLHLIPFNVVFLDGAGLIKGLSEMLEKEWPAILRWAVDGCLMWRMLGGLMPPAVVKSTTAAYFAEQDALTGFLAECCATDDPNARTETQALFDRFTVWCDAHAKEKLSVVDFPQKLESDHGFKRGHDPRTKRSQFQGIRLKELFL